MKVSALGPCSTGKAEGRSDALAVDLLAPNLNKEKMQYMAKMERENQKNAAQSRKDRDKAALDKQRYVLSFLYRWRLVE